MSSASWAEDAEASGIRTQELLADVGRAVGLLGAPDVDPLARHAVVQRFGGIGALLVIACEESWSQREWFSEDPGVNGPLGHLPGELGELLDCFSEMEAKDMDRLVAAIESSQGHFYASDVEAAARRWLNVTYAVAARDGTDEADRAYFQALDRVLSMKRELVSI